MKPLTPAMRKALVNALDTHNYTLLAVSGRTIGALEDRGLVQRYGAMGMYQLNAAGEKLASDIAWRNRRKASATVETTTPAQVAENALTAFMANATSDDPARYYADSEIYRTSQAALLDAIAVAYPDVNTMDVYNAIIDCNEDVAYCVALVRDRETAQRTEVAETTSVKIAELKELFTTNPSEALYRAEAELPHADFLDFIDFASGNDQCRHCGNPATTEHVTSDGEIIPLCESFMCLRKAQADDFIDDSDPRVVANGETPPTRQFCRTCLKSCVPAVTLTFDNGARRLHWCADHGADADAYRASADGFVPPLEIPGADDNRLTTAQLETMLAPTTVTAGAGTDVAVISGPASADPARTVHTAYTDALKPGMIVKPMQANPHLPAGPLTVAKAGPRNFGHVDVSFTDGTSVTAAETILWQIIGTAPTPDVTTVTTADLQPGMIAGVCLDAMHIDTVATGELRPGMTVRRAGSPRTAIVASVKRAGTRDGMDLWHVQFINVPTREEYAGGEAWYVYGPSTVASAPDPRVDYQTRTHRGTWVTNAVNLTYADAYKIIRGQSGNRKQGGAYRFVDSATGHAVTVHSDQPGELLASRYVRGSGDSYMVRRLPQEVAGDRWTFWIFRNGVFVHDTATSDGAYAWIASVAPGWGS